MLKCEKICYRKLWQETQACLFYRYFCFRSVYYCIVDFLFADQHFHSQLLAKCCKGLAVFLHSLMDIKSLQQSVVTIQMM